ncbi:MAG: redoxin domain-containing protein [Sulfurovum sp.]|nr:redoxin domain-containing protein [Sulfurovum sp.]MCB4780859.1 redoxin domain-containing protein [Sulfurovum sp.]
MKVLFTIGFPLFALMLLFFGCNEKPKESPLDNGNITKPLSQNLTESNNSKEYTNISNSHLNKENTFNFKDQKKIAHILSVENNQLLFKDISQPIVVLNFFSTWSLPCQSEAPYLSDLQKKYSHDIFVMGIMIHPNKYLKDLEAFILKTQVDYFISSSDDNDRFVKQILKNMHMAETFSIPLTIIYYKGNYYRHYEGIVPIEMIEHDVKVLLQ